MTDMFSPENKGCLYVLAREQGLLLRMMAYLLHNRYVLAGEQGLLLRIYYSSLDSIFTSRQICSR